MSYCQGCATRDAAIADLTREAQDLRASHSLCEQRVRGLTELLNEAAEALGYLNEFYDEHQGGAVTPKGESPEQLSDRISAALNLGADGK